MKLELVEVNGNIEVYKVSVEGGFLYVTKLNQEAVSTVLVPYREILLDRRPR